MAGNTNFPTSLDNNSTISDLYTNGPTGDTVDAAHVNNLGAAVKAIEAKLGINGSAVSTSVDYFINTVLGRSGNNLSTVGNLTVGGTFTPSSGNFVAPTTQAFGDSATAGANTTLNRSDHKHGMPALADFNRIVLKSADVSTANDATVNADASLTHTFSASQTWAFEVFVMFEENGGGLRWDFSVPSGTTMNYVYTIGTASGQVADNVVTGPTEKTHTAATFTDATKYVLRIKGTIAVSSTAGAVTFRWAQETSNAGNTTVYQNSSFQAWRTA